MLDPARHQPTNSIRLSNGIGSSTHGYGRWEASRSSGFWASKQVDEDESGICSPPLWKTSPTRSPQPHENHYQNLSPSSRTQAIARGHRELMEMVRNMPESTYELTLKDLVEKPTVEVGEENKKEERNLISKNIAYRREGSGSSSGRKVDQTALAKRSGDVQSGGFYLKMMFPTSLGSTKKKKKTKKSESLRPSMSEGCLKGGIEKEYWWKKSPSASGDSESGATSNNSGSTKSSGSSSSGSSRSSSSTRKERSRGSCWFLIGSKPKRLTQE